jgi:ESCRT-I complex subunit TSG101
MRPPSIYVFYLQTTRVLAEEQFTKRALIEKIQLGVPTGTSMDYS